MSYMRVPLMFTRWSVAAGLALAVSTSCTRNPDGRPLTLDLRTLDPPTTADIYSAEPQLTSGPGGTILSWLEHGNGASTLRFAARTTGGWSEPRTVASGDNWFVSYADVPMVIRLTNGTLVANWLEETNAFLEAYNLRLSYSRDGGRTWAAPLSPHHDGTTTQHGFASLFELPGKGVGLVWLDGRDMELNPTDPEGGAMGLWYAEFDGSWSQKAERVVNTRVCECCPTTAVVTDDGVLTAFRDRNPEEIRDISVSRLSGDGWTPATTIHNDNWMIPACPVNGPMLSASGRRVAAAWFTVKNDQGQAYGAFSEDAGRTWTTPIRLDDRGSLGRVDVELLDDGSAVATWVEFADQRAQFKARRIYGSGARSQAMEIASVDGGRASGYPRVSRHQQELVFAWAESSGAEADELTSRVRARVAPVPR